MFALIRKYSLQESTAFWGELLQCMNLMYDINVKIMLFVMIF